MLSQHDYDDLLSAVTEHGFYAFVRFDDAFGYRLVCASKRRIPSGYTGNSYWIVVKDNQWYIASWGYRYWRIPQAESVRDVCLKWLSGDSGVGAPPDDVLRDYQLEELEREEFLEVFIDTYIPYALRSVWDAQQQQYEHTHRFAADLVQLCEFAKCAPWEDLPSDFEIEVLLKRETWSAVAMSPQDPRRFAIDAAGNVTAFEVGK